MAFLIHPSGVTEYVSMLEHGEPVYPSNDAFKRVARRLLKLPEPSVGLLQCRLRNEFTRFWLTFEHLGSPRRAAIHRNKQRNPRAGRLLACLATEVRGLALLWSEEECPWRF